MDKTYLIEEAKRRYPIGTTCIPLRMDGIDYGTPYTIVEHKPFFMEKDDALCLSTKGSGFGSVYVKGKWATIVKPAEPLETMEEQIKIVNETSIKVGYYLTCWIKSNTEKKFIIQVTDLCLEDPERVMGNYISSMSPYSPTNVGYYKNDRCSIKSDDRTFRRSTQAEINHLNACIEAGKYVELVEDTSSKKVETTYEQCVRMFPIGCTILTPVGNKVVVEKIDECPTELGSISINNNRYNAYCGATKRFATIVKIPTEEFPSGLKKGDWVIGWHNTTTDYGYDSRPWQVGNINTMTRDIFIYPLFNNPDYNTSFDNVKKLSQQQVLDWVDKEYPVDCSYKNVSDTRYKTPQKRTCTPRFCANFNTFKGIEIGNGFVYYDGKWGEKVEDVKPEMSTSRGLRPTMSVIDETMMYQPVAIGEAYLGTMPPFSTDHRLITNNQPSKKKSGNSIIDRYVKENPEDLLG